MLDWVDETPTGLDQVSAFSEDGNRAARIRVESFTPDVHKGVILEAMTVHEATGLTPSQLQARVAELEAALAKARDLAKYDQYDLPDAEGGMEQAWRDGYQSAVDDLREALK